MKKIGIVVDNWKLESFEKVFQKKNIEFTTKKYSKHAMVIFITCEDATIAEIAVICADINRHLTQKKQEEN